MKIIRKLTLSFVSIALLVGIVGYFSISLSKQIRGLRTIELPMEQNLREVEVSIWEAIHAADAFLASADPHYSELYHKQLGDVDEFYAKYLALTDTVDEKEFAKKFELLWSQGIDAGNKMLELVEKEKEAEDKFFDCVDKADDVIDFKIQTKFSANDPKVLAKEQALREVEVSIWEAIHAAAQYTGLTKNIQRAEHSQKTFAELMEKQFSDVDEFWQKYKELATSESEKEAVKEFEQLWSKATAAGKMVITLHDQAKEQFGILYEKVDKADDVIDFKMQEFIQKRIVMEDKKAKQVRAATIALSVFALISAIVVGVFTSRSVSRPIIKLRDAAAEIGKGDLIAKVKIKSKDEIGTLAQSFNRMTEDLKKTTTSITNLNREITERKRAEEQLQKKTSELAKVQEATLSMAEDIERENAERKQAEEALEVSNKELRDFVYIASHDLREPLRKISSFGMLLEESLEGKLQGEDQENLEFMIDGVNRMTQMINSLLEYSRVGGKAIVYETVDLNETIEQLEQLELAALLEETGGVVEVPQPLPSVQADPVQIRQLLQNLIANGIKYHREGIGPRIVIRAVQAARDAVRIEVQDNGIGIEKEHHRRIFKMLKRLHSRDKYDGAGIGLSVCQKIVYRHGGRIGVESEADAGSTFWFTLPASKSLEKEQEKLISSLET